MLLSHYYEGLVEVGCDEAGRGCLAGSVYAAAVFYLPTTKTSYSMISKKLSAKKRLLHFVQR